MLREIVFRAANVAGLRSEESEEEDEAVGRRLPPGPERVALQGIMMMIECIHYETLRNFMETMPSMFGMNIDYDAFHNLKKEIEKAKKEYEREQQEKEEHIPVKHQDDSEYKHIDLDVKDRKKGISLETKEDLPVDVAVPWFNMLNAAQKKKVVNRVVSSIRIKEEPKTKPKSFFRRGIKGTRERSVCATSRKTKARRREKRGEGCIKETR